MYQSFVTTAPMVGDRRVNEPCFFFTLSMYAMRGEKGRGKRFDIPITDCGGKTAVVLPAGCPCSWGGGGGGERL